MENEKTLLFVDKNNVRVFAGDTMLIAAGKSDRFNGIYGTILETKEGRAVLCFSKEFASIFYGEADEKKRMAMFDLSEIIKIDLSEHPELRANALYNRRHYYHVAKLPYPFSPENKCICGGCQKLVTKRIMYNVQGIVSEYDVCEEHEHFDAGHGDIFPGEHISILEKG